MSLNTQAEVEVTIQNLQPWEDRSCNLVHMRETKTCPHHQLGVGELLCEQTVDSFTSSPPSFSSVSSDLCWIEQCIAICLPGCCDFYLQFQNLLVRFSTSFCSDNKYRDNLELIFKCPAASPGLVKSDWHLLAWGKHISKQKQNIKHRYEWIYWRRIQGQGSFLAKFS